MFTAGPPWAERSRSHPGVLGVEHRRGVVGGDGDRIALAHVLHLELGAHHRVLGWQVAHEDVLADRRSGAGAGHVGAAAVGVGDRLAVAGEDRLAAEHVALDPGLRGVVIDGQRAHRHRLGLLAVAHVRRLADEVSLLDPAPCHAGLDDVVLALELGAVGAVALLQAARWSRRRRPPPRLRRGAARPRR